MKGLLVLTLSLLAAATAFAYGPADVSALATAWPGEPTALLLSGGALIGAAGALRRLPY